MVQVEVEVEVMIVGKEEECGGQNAQNKKFERLTIDPAMLPLATKLQSFERNSTLPRCLLVDLQGPLHHHLSVHHHQMPMSHCLLNQEHNHQHFFSPRPGVNRHPYPAFH